MSKHSPHDRQLLQHLVRQGRITREEATELWNSLDLYQVENARVRIPDLLVQKQIITVAELAQFMARIEEEEEQDAIAHGRAPAPAAAAPAEPAPSAGGRNALIVVSVVGTLILIGVAVWLAGGSEPEPAPPPKEVVKVQPVAPPPPPEPEPEPEPIDPLEVALRDELEQSVQIADVRERIEALDEIYTRSSSRLPVDADIRAAQRAARRELDGMARVAFDAAKPEWQALLDEEKFSEAVSVLDGLLDRFGVEAIDGEIQHQRSLVQQTIERYCARMLRAGKRSLSRNSLVAAKRDLDRVARLGSRSQVAEAEEMLREIAAKSSEVAGSSADDDVADAAIARGSARADESDATSDEVAAGPGDSEDDVADDDDTLDEDDEPDVPVDPRIVNIRDRLVELLPSGKATLSDDGILTATYELHDGDRRSGYDWVPDIEGAQFSDKTRWSTPREATGVRVSENGFWRHRARLVSGVKFQVRYQSLSGYRPQNMFALVWMSDRGLGVATNMGQQTGYVNTGRVTSLKGRLRPHSAGDPHELMLEVGETHFKGRFGTARTQERPNKKGQKNGFCGVIWKPQIKAVLLHVHVEGKLDLDWAEKELGKR